MPDPFFLDLGGVEIARLPGGEFALDGGAMFGAVPKTLWSRHCPPDEANRIRLCNHPLLVRGPGGLALIDTGLGGKLDERQRRNFAVGPDWDLPAALERLDIAPEDIAAVILTHCDFDHAGGVVAPDGSPCFPRARHVVQRLEWQDVRYPCTRARHTYLPENFTGLEDSGLLELIDGDVEVLPGITVRHTGGHTRGHQLVEIQGRDGLAVHLGDLLPTHVHAHPLWIMAYDNFPLEVIRLKEVLLPRYQARNAWFLMYHDIAMAACRLDSQGAVSERLP